MADEDHVIVSKEEKAVGDREHEIESEEEDEADEEEEGEGTELEEEEGEEIELEEEEGEGTELEEEEGEEENNDSDSDVTCSTCCDDSDSGLENNMWCIGDDALSFKKQSKNVVEVVTQTTKDVVVKGRINSNDRYDSCTFCNKLVKSSSLTRHLERIHKNEKVIIDYTCLRKGSLARKRKIQLLRNLGNFSYNPPATRGKT